MPQSLCRWVQYGLPTLFLGLLPWTCSSSRSGELAQQSLPPRPLSAGVLARAADTLIESIGTNLHLSYVDTVYNQFDTVVKPRLLELGIRHVRDGAHTDGAFYPTYYQRCKALAERGIRFNLVINNRAEGKQWVPSSDFTKLSTIYRACGQGVESFEGSNEPDLFGPRNGAPDWVESTREGQRLLYIAVKGNATLSQLPVLAPALTSLDAAIALGDLSAYTDYGNIHNYYAGRHPESNGWGSAFQLTQVRWGQRGCRELKPHQIRPGDPNIGSYGTVPFNRLCLATPVSGNKPMIATETGWDNAIHRPRPQVGSIPEAIAAVYVPRLFLHHWNQGITRTYIYEFLDVKPDPTRTDPEHNFGLVRNDGTPKPAFYALKSLIQILSDRGGTFRPQSLNYRLSGQTTHVQQALFQKRDGDFYLALWLGVPIWEPVQRRPLTVPAQPVTVSLQEASIQQLARIDWQTDGSITINKHPLNKISDRESQVKLQVSPQLTILRLSSRR